MTVRRLRIVAISLAALLGLSLIWGYSQMRLQRTYTIRLENNYQRAFHELVWHLRAVEDELATLGAANSMANQITCLATVWRQIYAAQAKIGQLPLGLVSLDQTEAYLAQLGDQVFDMARSGAPLRDADRRRLSQFQARAREINEDLVTIQATILEQNLRWTEIERSLVAARRENEHRDNTIINNFELVNKRVEEYPEVRFDQRMGLAFPPPTALRGPQVNQAQAQETALWFLSPTDRAAFRIVATEATHGLIPTYSFLLQPQEGNRQVRLEVTQQNGRVLYLIDNRQLGQASIDHNTALQQASDFLRTRGFPNMRLVGRTEYQDALLLAYVYEQNGVLIYPDLLRVKVALDNGEIIGFEGNGFTAYHQQERDLPAPGIEVGEALAALSEGLELYGEEQLVVIFNARGEEALAYEFPVRNTTDHFLVYIDAIEGEELQIIRLAQVPLPEAPVQPQG